MPVGRDPSPTDPPQHSAAQDPVQEPPVPSPKRSPRPPECRDQDPQGQVVDAEMWRSRPPSMSDNALQRAGPLDDAIHQISETPNTAGGGGNSWGNHNWGNNNWKRKGKNGQGRNDWRQNWNGRNSTNS